MKRLAVKNAVGAAGEAQEGSAFGVMVDPYRNIVFPNAVRDVRKRAGYPKLLALAAKIPDIPYIRLSKIERGEVIGKPAEIARIAQALKVAPQKLLIDVDSSSFDMARWAEPIHELHAIDVEAEVFAVLLAAAVKLRRRHDRLLTIATIEKHYGIPPVVLSRIENAQKTLDRWNSATIAALCRLFEVSGVDALRAAVYAAHQSGQLDPLIGEIVNPQQRVARMRARIAELRAQLSGAPVLAGAQGGPVPALAAVEAAPEASAARLLPVFGAPLPDGLIALAQTAETVEAPGRAGPRAYGLRVFRPTLGGGLPAHTTLVVDPDRFPSSGLAVLKEKGGCRLLAVGYDRNGAMIGYSENPRREIALDGVDRADLAAVISAVFD